ncbi:MAG TPA: Hpt domain-containing protein [Sphingobium sp.]|nr:Hpt domain-containing protein [Sphingobium sp.]
MAYQNTHLEAIISAAIGDDPSLMRDLRQAFMGSAEEYVAALGQATSIHEWQMAAWRFKGLCATFGVQELAGLAAEATASSNGDIAILRRIRAALTDLAAQD